MILIAYLRKYAAYLQEKNLFAEPSLYGELDDGGRLKRRADFRHWEPFFCLFQQRLLRKMSQRDIRSLFGKKAGGGDDE